MKKLLVVTIVLALAIIFMGCDSWLTQSYSSIKPHEEYSDAQSQDSLEAASTSDLLDIVKEQVNNGVENCVIYVVDLDVEKLNGVMEIIVQEVTQRYPIGAFAVDDIQFDIGTSTGRTAIAVKITYKRSRSEILRIENTRDMDEVMSVVAEAVEDCKTGIVVQVEDYRDFDIAQRIQDYVDAHPETCMEMPQVSEAVYPDSGPIRVIELSFTYQTSRDVLRSMQLYVQPIFRAAVLNVSGEEEENLKFSRMYAFLMERNEYQVETSLTPAYSLLRHGVGDSKAFATVYAAMCREAGLECQVITGTRAGEPWTWNLICEDGLYYHVDLLRSNEAGQMRRLYQNDMDGYVWDYSAFPVAEAPVPPPVEPTQVQETEQEVSQPQETVPDETEPEPSTTREDGTDGETTSTEG